MSTSLKNKEDIQKFYKQNLNQEDFDQAYEARMISYRILSEVDRIMEERSISKKELAQQLGTSASYVTQLFNGSKLLNLNTIAKLQQVLGVKYSFSLEGENEAQIEEARIRNLKPYPIRPESFSIVAEPSDDE